MSIPHHEIPPETPERTGLQAVEPITIDTLFSDYRSLHPSSGRKPGAVDTIEIYGATPSKQLSAILRAIKPVYPAASEVDPIKSAHAYDALARSEVTLRGGRERVASSLGDITVLAAILEQHAPEHLYSAFAAVMDQVVRIDAKRPAEKRKLGTGGIVRLGSLALFALQPDQYTDDVVRILKNRHDPGELA